MKQQYSTGHQAMMDNDPDRKKTKEMSPKIW